MLGLSASRVTSTHLKMKLNKEKDSRKDINKALSLPWPAAMQIYRNKGKCCYKKIFQFPEAWFGTWSLCYYFGTPKFMSLSYVRYCNM